MTFKLSVCALIFLGLSFKSTLWEFRIFIIAFCLPTKYSMEHYFLQIIQGFSNLLWLFFWLLRLTSFYLRFEFNLPKYWTIFHNRYKGCVVWGYNILNLGIFEGQILGQKKMTYIFIGKCRKIDYKNIFKISSFNHIIKPL